VALVAVLPIFREKRLRKTRSRNLRSRLLTYFTALRPILGKRIDQVTDDENSVTPLNVDEQEPIRAIEALIAQADLLDPDEHDLVSAAFINIVLLRRAPEIKRRTAREVLQLVDQTRERLEKGGFLHSKMLKLPW